MSRAWRCFWGLDQQVQQSPPKTQLRPLQQVTFQQPTESVFVDVSPIRQGAHGANQEEQDNDFMPDLDTYDVDLGIKNCVLMAIRLQEAKFGISPIRSRDMQDDCCQRLKAYLERSSAKKLSFR